MGFGNVFEKHHYGVLAVVASSEMLRSCLGTPVTSNREPRFRGDAVTKKL
jgi:hypothetical protein